MMVVSGSSTPSGVSEGAAFLAARLLLYAIGGGDGGGDDKNGENSDRDGNDDSCVIDGESMAVVDMAIVKTRRTLVLSI